MACLAAIGGAYHANKPCLAGKRRKLVMRHSPALEWLLLCFGIITFVQKTRLKLISITFCIFIQDFSTAKRKRLQRMPESFFLALHLHLLLLTNNSLLFSYLLKGSFDSFFPSRRLEPPLFKNLGPEVSLHRLVIVDTVWILVLSNTTTPSLACRGVGSTSSEPAPRCSPEGQHRRQSS